MATASRRKVFLPKLARYVGSSSSSAVDGELGRELDLEFSRQQRRKRRKEQRLEAEAVMAASSSTSSSSSVDKRAPSVENKETAESEAEPCGICFEAIEERGILNCCEHKFCFGCIEKWFQRSCRCPLCKRVVTGLTSSTTGASKSVARRELRDTLSREDDESDEDIHDFMDHIALVARSLGLRINYMHRTEIPSPPLLPEMLLPSNQGLWPDFDDLLDTNPSIPSRRRRGRASVSRNGRAFAPPSSSSTSGSLPLDVPMRGPTRSSRERPIVGTTPIASDSTFAQVWALHSGIRETTRLLRDAIRSRAARNRSSTSHSSNRGATTSSNSAPRMSGSGTEHDPILLDD